MAPASSPEEAGNRRSPTMPTPPPAPKLTLIGAVHRDPRGAERLLAALRRLRPDLVTLEMSAKAFAYRQGEARLQLQRLEEILARLAEETARPLAELLALPAIADIRALLDLPFEYRAAADYAAEAGISVQLIDLCDVSAVKLRRVETSLITYRNLRVLIKLPLGQEKNGWEGYELARSLIGRDPGSAVRQAFLERRRGDEGIGPRDRWMAEQIARLLADGRVGHLVHIGGWVHMVGDERGETLFSLLERFEPVRELLG